MVVVLLRPLRPLQRPDLVAGHEHALLPAHQLQLRHRLQLGEAALVAVGDGGAVAGLDGDARQGLVLPLQYTMPPISFESWRTMILQQK